MAESQEIITYTRALLAALDRSLSPERLAPYLGVAAQDRKHALHLYLWNARLSKSFLYPLNMAEVAIRNAMYNAISNEYADPNWLLNPPFPLTRHSRTSLDVCAACVVRRPRPT
ncbi:hypothetical protein [Asticcacaulis endophyticus]|uniref:Uncharacterized protein n=1 Tax=Asticcacaulis endophyticus TaxID=1395890 RepID=A0A918Q4Z2_9CAUL|nr:hypothetical protein [Asticcacaulis endophyticus]GGZ32186.1 hypothetical protein GCM10011273_17830 [Asticcacaulis endophyticus]